MLVQNVLHLRCPQSGVLQELRLHTIQRKHQQIAIIICQNLGDMTFILQKAVMENAATIHSVNTSIYRKIWQHFKQHKCRLLIS